MTTQTLKLEDIENKNLKDLLQTVSTQNQILTIQLPNGNEVLIHPKSTLKPLPTFEGSIPKDWKQAIYEFE